MNTKARRYLSVEKLKDQYTEDDLIKLLGTSTDYTYSILKKRSGNTHRRRWSHIEDKFLLDTYNYITDATIALALNIPIYEVHRHRTALGLRKVVTKDVPPTVWHNRDNFEQDMQRMYLTKARGDGVHPQFS